jgi:hypothetical protein
MHRLVTISLAALPLLAAGCHADQTGSGAVRAQYDNSADQVEQQAQAQPNPTAKKIYKARADALREEGKDRQTGLEGGTPSSGPGKSQ